MPLGDGTAKKETKEINEELGFILDAVSSIGDKLVASFEDAVDSADALNSGVEIVGKTMQRGLAANLKAVVKSSENLINLQAKVNLGLNVGADIEKESLRIKLNKEQLLVKQKVLAGSLTDSQKELLALELEQLNKQEATVKELKKQLALNIKNKSLTDILKDNAESIADKIDKSGTLTQILKGGLGSVFNVTKLVQLSAVALFKALQSSDKASGELAKSMNITYREANILQIKMTEVANSSMSAKVTTVGLGQALMAVNKELGVTNTTVDENLVFFQQMHKYAGLTYEELKGVNAITNATGGDLKSNTGEILAQATLQGTRLGVALNEKEVLKDISKVSAATTLSLGMSANEIGKAVSVAKSLGMELGKVDDIAGSLLDFEQSISNELEAEMLLGKDLNLEKARTAALNNDLVTVAEEIAKQAGSAADFGKMNRIEQEALAKAVGMGREELAKTLFTQEQLKGLAGDELAIREKQINELQAKGLSQEAIKAKLAATSVEELKKQVSVQENLEASVEKLKEVFVSIAGPIMQVVSPIVDALMPALSAIPILLTPVVDLLAGMSGLLSGNIESLDEFQIILGAIGVAYLAHIGYQKIIAGYELAKIGYGYAQQALQASNKAGILGTIGALTVQLGISLGILSASLATNAAVTFGVGVAIAIVAAAAGYYAIKALAKADDMVSPGGSGSGYGTRTLMGPEGAIALNNKDTVIAGTNLFPKGDDVMSTGAGEIQIPAPADNRRMEGLLESLVRDQRARPVIANPGVIQIQ